MDVSENRGVSPKMDGENHGKAPIKMDDLGKTPYFWKHPYLVASHEPQPVEVRLRESGMIHRAASMDTFIEKSASRSDNVVPAAALQELFFAQVPAFFSTKTHGFVGMLCFFCGLKILVRWCDFLKLYVYNPNPCF